MRSLTFSSSVPLEPGRYRRDGFLPALSFQVPAGWLAIQDVPGFFDVELGADPLDVIAVQFARPVDAVSAAVGAAALRSRPGVTAGPVEPVMIGADRGLRLTVDASNPDLQARVFVDVLRIGLGPISIASGRRLQVTFVDTADGLLAILVGGSVRAWEQALAAATPVVESIRFEEPPV